jgi:FKBP-type peptidyl-prolyl cis-trans isomerase SlyD
VLDANHPLAGIALRFWLQVADTGPATPEEIENGRASEQFGLQVDERERIGEKILKIYFHPHLQRPEKKK